MNLPSFIRPRSEGFTLMEILIVMAILIFLMMVLLTNYWKQLRRGFDAQRKTDLNKIARAMEEYYNDHGCYPPESALAQCGAPGGIGLQPYLEFIPCDPETKLPYKYDPADPTNVCDGYRLFTNLKDTSDPDIGRVGCIGGCFGNVGINYNYGVSSGVPVGYGYAGSAPTPTPDPNGKYACVNFNAGTGVYSCNDVGTDSTCDAWVIKYSDGNACDTNCRQATYGSCSN